MPNSSKKKIESEGTPPGAL